MSSKDTQQQKKYKILLIGELCQDVYVFGKVNRISPEAPVPIIKKTRKEFKEGMSGNVYKNIVQMLPGAEITLQQNEMRNIKKIRFIDEKSNYQIMRYDIEKPIENFDIKNIPIQEYDAIVISDYNKGFMTEEDIAYVAKSHPLTFLDTKKILGDWCKDITFIKINDNEFEKTRHMVGPEIESKMIMTMGSEGCRYAGVTYSVPSVEIKDPSGAGDTFVASLAYKYVESDHNMEKAIEFANKCATEVVQRRGVSTV